MPLQNTKSPAESAGDLVLNVELILNHIVKMLLGQAVSVTEINYPLRDLVVCRDVGNAPCNLELISLDLDACYPVGQYITFHTLSFLQTVKLRFVFMTFLLSDTIFSPFFESHCVFLFLLTLYRDYDIICL